MPSAYSSANFTTIVSHFLSSVSLLHISWSYPLRGRQTKCGSGLAPAAAWMGLWCGWQDRRAKLRQLGRGCAGRYASGAGRNRGSRTLGLGRRRRRGRLHFDLGGKKSRGGEHGHGDGEPGSKHGFLRNAVRPVSQGQISCPRAAKPGPEVNS